MADFLKIPLRALPPVLIAAGAGGIIACALVKNSIAIGFAVGYIIGVVNALWFLNTVKKGVTLDPVKAGSHVAGHYYLRFFATVAVFTALMYLRLLNTWSPVAGFSTAMFATVGVIVYYALSALKAKDGAA